MFHVLARTCCKRAAAVAIAAATATTPPLDPQQLSYRARLMRALDTTPEHRRARALCERIVSGAEKRAYDTSYTSDVMRFAPCYHYRREEDEQPNGRRSLEVLVAALDMLKEGGLETTVVDERTRHVVDVGDNSVDHWRNIYDQRRTADGTVESLELCFKIHGWSRVPAGRRPNPHYGDDW